MTPQDRMAIPVADLFRRWGRVLTGHFPSISIEITRECPLRCPGCYAYTPQTGEYTPEVLSPGERIGVLEELAALRPRFPKVELPDAVIAGYRDPPASPDERVFARWGPAFAADLATRITPCQLGGDPDCSRCGCMPAAGLKSLGDCRLIGLLPVRSLARASAALGEAARRRRGVGVRDQTVSGA